MSGAAQPRWLSWRIVEQMHQDLVAEHGGSYGIRDEGLIESALARPRNHHAYGQDADVFLLAAAYLHGLVKNHGFVDGNKRVGFMAAYVFLGLNGQRLAATEAQAYEMVISVAEGKLDEAGAADWLREHSQARR